MSRAQRFVSWNEQRFGSAKGVRWLLRYVFPDHWSFLLGEVALYAFIVLVITGIFLALFYQPSDTHMIYHGSYTLLDGQQISEAYHSVLNLSLTVPAGLLMRQTHHWAADVFLAAIVLHVMRVFFTGAFRKPRDVNWFVGLTMLMLAIFEGFAGYSLGDDLMSGMGLAIAYSVAMSVPLIGAQLAHLLWDGSFPGGSDFLPRLEIAHALLIPAALAGLISVHLALIMRQHHSQFPGRGRKESNVVGTPMWPGYALRSIGLLLAVAGILFLLGGLVQINPIWQWGPYEPYLSTNGAQPDWYIGWLIGALRLMPNFEPTIAGHTPIPNPFWGGVAFPGVVFTILFFWPAAERRFSGDRRRHDLLDRPRDKPQRTALGAALLSWVVLIFAVGAADRVSFRLNISYAAQIHVWRVGVWVVPVVVYLLSLSAARALQRSGAHPLRGSPRVRLRRRPSGEFELVDAGSPSPEIHERSGGHGERRCERTTE
ncbi:MAG: cytochrome bc complex cytochrome b subunit [Solirubrobacterales bacterium]|nr:cytochrome bc complex cytochrome b subunit [Solirubrobacterales bacterium]